MTRRPCVFICVLVLRRLFHDLEPVPAFSWLALIVRLARVPGRMQRGVERWKIDRRQIDTRGTLLKKNIIGTNVRNGA